MNTAEHSLHDLSASDVRWTAALGGIRLHYGPGARSELLDELRRLGVERPLIVTDPGVRATGRVDELAAGLSVEGLAVAVFDAVDENPTTAHVDAGTAAARDHSTDGLVGFGGGSAMDVAKGVNFLLSHGGRIEDYWGRDLVAGPMLASVGIPTTAGTGSEAQSFALIARVDDHRKMACGAEGARFRTVLLDPELLGTVPHDVAVAAALDAASHAFESHVSTAANPVSRLYSRAAWERLRDAMTIYLHGGRDVSTAGTMLLGAHLAGAAIECSMLGAAHACANPLTARYDLTHGIAVGLLLPHVVRYNQSAVPDRYAELLGSDVEPARAAEELIARTGVAPRLRDHGIEQERLAELAVDAAAQWTARFNPREADAAQLLQIYENAY